eukprot:1159025-Pelagomonas_calceolata.AAC.6
MPPARICCQCWRSWVSCECVREGVGGMLCRLIGPMGPPRDAICPDLLPYVSLGKHVCLLRIPIPQRPAAGRCSPGV